MHVGYIENDLVFSAASLWEITLKNRLGRKDFCVDPRLFRRGLLDNGYSELAITGLHAITVDLLPDLHRDPFDRLLIAQALSEGIIFLTNDTLLAKYPGAIRIIRVTVRTEHRVAYHFDDKPFSGCRLVYPGWVNASSCWKPYANIVASNRRLAQSPACFRPALNTANQYGRHIISMALGAMPCT